MGDMTFSRSQGLATTRRSSRGGAPGLSHSLLHHGLVWRQLTGGCATAAVRVLVGIRTVRHGTRKLLANISCDDTTEFFGELLLEFQANVGCPAERVRHLM